MTNKNNSVIIINANMADFNELIGSFINDTKDYIFVQNINEDYSLWTKSITFTTSMSKKRLLALPSLVNLADAMTFNGKNVKLNYL